MYVYQITKKPLDFLSKNNQINEELSDVTYETTNIIKDTYPTSASSISTNITQNTSKVLETIPQEQLTQEALTRTTEFTTTTNYALWFFLGVITITIIYIIYQYIKSKRN